MPKSNKHTSSQSHWQLNPYDWVTDHFGDAVKLTSQQRHYFDQLGFYIRCKSKSVQGRIMSKEEVSMSRKIGFSISAGRGVGKDFTAALTILFLLTCFPDCRVPTIANSAQQLKNVLWSEVARLMRLAKKAEDGQQTVLEYILDWSSERIYHRGSKATWFAEALAVPSHADDDLATKTLAGRHSSFMGIICDEAAGIRDAVFAPLEHTMTSKDGINFALLIFNPIQTRGYAIESQTLYADKWVTLTWSQEDCPELIDRQLIADMAAKYGRDSNTFRINVLGIPPLAGSGSFLPPDWIVAAQQRPYFESDEKCPVIFGVDVGGGGDSSIICVRQGGNVLKFIRNSDKNLMEVAEWVALESHRWSAAAIFVDIVGLGKGCYDRLRELNVSGMVRSADARNTARKPERYYNRRSEWYLKLRDMFELGLISLPSDDRDIADELNAIVYFPEQKNKIGDKRSIRKNLGGNSPDSADALAISLESNDGVYNANSAPSGMRNAVNYQGVYLR